jgi:hypothetical protein
VTAFVDVALGRKDTGPALRAHLEQAGWKAPSSVDYEETETSSSL